MEQIDFTPKGLSDKIEKTITVPFQRFEKYTSDFGVEHLYCFVEGHDLPYYNVRVEAISGKQCSIVDSGGKKNVIALHEMLKGKKEYAKYKTLYFVDRDYDDNSALDQAIYVTPCYSIENLYASNKAFMKIVEGLFHVYSDNEKQKKCIELYEAKKQEFTTGASLFCAWYKCVRSKTVNTVKLNDDFPSNYVDIGVKGKIIIYDYDLHKMNTDYNLIEPISPEELSNAKVFIDTDPINNIRGKYVLQFLEYMINLLSNDSKTNKTYTESKITIPQNRKLLVSNLSSYADIPDILREYIKNHI
ncbi:MAG: DUF4435 domain-containing protein [Bacteroidales bacterium]|nr:DUF4435 domain-containing protein [Bacteroidales bacterium]